MAPLHPGGRRKRGEDFEEKVVEWKAKTNANTFTNFKAFFVDRNTIVRNCDTHKKTKVKDTGFHRANITREIEE